jgi:hypothetical protein
MRSVTNGPASNVINDSDADSTRHRTVAPSGFNSTTQCNNVESSSHLPNIESASGKATFMHLLPDWVLDAIERVRLGIDDPDPGIRERFRRRIQS